MMVESTEPARADDVRKIGIFILGMHRSGTSALTSLLAELGFHYGSEPLPAQSQNPRGYFEDRRIVDVHDNFLTDHRTTWADPRPLPSSWFDSAAATTASDRLGEILRQDFLLQPRWVVKDPRLCRLLPLWMEWVETAAESHSVGFLHLLRSPMAVARSLERRDGFSPTKSALLWLRHQLESERATRGRDRAFVSFKSLVEGNSAVVHETLSRLACFPSIEVEEIQRVYETSFSSSLVRSEPLVESTGVPWNHPWIERTFSALGLLLEGENAAAHSELDNIRSQLETADQLLMADGGYWETELQQDRFTLLADRVERTNLQLQHVSHWVDQIADQQRDCLEQEAAFRGRLESALTGILGRLDRMDRLVELASPGLDEESETRPEGFESPSREQGD